MPRSRFRRWWPALLLGLLAISLLVSSQFVCLYAWLRWGVVVAQCPDGTPRQTARAEAHGLRRGGSGRVTCAAAAHYTTGPADAERIVWLPEPECRLALVRDGKESPLEPKKEWTAGRGQVAAQIELPQLPDGDYLLRARVKSALAESTVDVPLAIYAPARVHVITDRPLYEPGNTVRFRAVALRARDLAPLDGRPGRWVVTDPTGEALLEERAPAGEWGVVAGSFPLDAGAQSGTWTVRWVSGDASDSVSFRVEPFTLPRFRVEASADRPFYGRGGRPTVRGSVVYSSGAPVAGAQVTLDWSNSGEWPPPTEWMEGGLPKLAKTDEAGRFSFDLPVIPGDLRGRATLSARLSAIDAAGDRVEGGLSLQLAEEPIQVSAITELGNGLVAGFNNRVWLRVTDGAGQLLPNAALRVTRAWDPADKGIEAVADEDGVAALQLDPGPPVNVVIPPMPVRPPKPQPAVERTGAHELITSREASLAEMREMDGWNARLEPCARFLENASDSVTLGLRVSSGGEVTAVGAVADPLSSCLAKVLHGARLPAGGERLFQVEFALQAPGLPALSLSPYGAPESPDGLTEQLNRFALDAGECLPRTLSEAVVLPRVLTWRARAGSKQVELGWLRDPQADSSALAAGPAACVERKVGQVSLEQAPQADLLGYVRFTANPGVGEDGPYRPQPTVRLGYELKIAASIGGEPVGEAKLRLSPGQVPPVRLRATPVVAEPGGKVAVEIVRGPEFRGKLPEKLFLQAEARQLEAKVDEKKRAATFELPADLQGWLQVEWNGARAVAYVPPRGQLGLELKSEREAYAPGQTANLLLQTTLDGKGAPAAVGLFGVDESLAQLAPLAGPDDMARVRPQVGVSEPAFGVLDAQALAMGRVRGARAAEAVVLKVTSLPTPAELDRVLHASGQTVFDPIAELTDRFYVALAELHAQARVWEKSAPAGEQMTPAKMAKLWSQAVEACEKRGEQVRDAYGRKLTLSGLPGDLLSLVDPRAVIVEGTRLPEDTENWAAWVVEERP